ncbi:hypothetical protein OROGR_020820 [Orobanche gracilis]
MLKDTEKKDANDTLEMLMKAKHADVRDPIAPLISDTMTIAKERLMRSSATMAGFIFLLTMRQNSMRSALSRTLMSPGLRGCSGLISFLLFHWHALRHMKGGSSIINTTSVNAYKGNAKLLDYTATKGAIVAFTRGLALQLVDKGIRVNGVAPGPIWTSLIPASFTEDETENFGKEVPMKRAGQPIEVTPSCVPGFEHRFILHDRTGPSSQWGYYHQCLMYLHM